MPCMGRPARPPPPPLASPNLNLRGLVFNFKFKVSFFLSFCKSAPPPTACTPTVLPTILSLFSCDLKSVLFTSGHLYRRFVPWQNMWVKTAFYRIKEIFWCSDISMFRYFDVQIFWCSDISMFRYFDVQIFRCSDISMFRYFHVQIFWCSSIRSQTLFFSCCCEVHFRHNYDKLFMALGR